MSIRQGFSTFGWAFLGFFGALVLYHPALSFDFLTYDDPFFVRNNPNVASGFSWDAFVWAWTANLLSVERLAEYWMPLTLLSRQLDSQLFGLDGGWYHLQNVLLHGLNAALVFRIFSTATGATVRSAVLGAIFLLHPVNTEVVCWIALRKDVLAATFSLLTLLWYVRYRQSRLSRHYVFALLAFSAALASKPAVISLPLALFLFDLWPLGSIALRPWKLRAWVEALIEKLPFVALALLVGYLTYVGQVEAGSARGVWESTFAQKVAATTTGMLDYTRRVVLPYDLCILYPQRNPALVDPFRLGSSIVLLVGVTLGMLTLAWRRHAVGLSGWLWFLGLLLPVSGLVAFGRQATADRYLYLPMIGLLFALVWLGAEVWAARARFGLGGHWARYAGIALLGFALLGLGLATRSQMATWRNGFTVWEHAMRVEPDHTFALQMLGGDHIIAQRMAVGENYLRAAIKLEPERGESQGKLGYLLALHGKPAAAVPLLDGAIRARPRDQKLHGALIAALRQLGRSEDALRAEVRWQLVRLDAFLQNGLELLRAGEADVARDQFDLAWASVAEARRSKTRYELFRQGSSYWARIREGIVASSQPANLFESEYMNAVVTYLTAPQEATKQFEAVCQRFPDQAAAWWRLAICARADGNATLAEGAESRARSARYPAADVEAEWKLDAPIRPAN